MAEYICHDLLLLGVSSLVCVTIRDARKSTFVV